MAQQTVQQIKLFKSVDTELADLERQVNRWIRKHHVRVLSVNANLAGQPPQMNPGSGGGLSSFGSGDVLVVVHYEVDVPDAS